MKVCYMFKSPKGSVWSAWETLGRPESPTDPEGIPGRVHKVGKGTEASQNIEGFRAEA